MTDPGVAELLAALTYGERRALRRAEANVALAPDGETRVQQQGVADAEREALELLEARLAEVGSPDLEVRFHPYFDPFFEATEPGDWIEAQTFHYVGDALVADFGEAVIPGLDRISGEVVRKALCERDEQDAFALDQVTGSIRKHPSTTERVADYARRVAGEALTQTRRALEASGALSGVLGGEEEQKRVILQLLDRHRRRLDRLGIEAVDAPPPPEE